MQHNLSTPEGRHAAIEKLGPAAYSAAFEAYRTAAILTAMSGHAIRPVNTRFGRLFAVGDTGRAFATLNLARAFALANPAERGQ